MSSRVMLAVAAIVVLTLSFVASAAAAEDRAVRVSAGYAFAKYLEEGAGSAPLGLYFSLGTAKRPMGLELDLGYHRDSEDYYSHNFVLHTFTATAGPKFVLRDSNTTPFLHVLGGLRYDKAEESSNTAWGGIAGLGVDVPISSKAFLRLGADYEMFFDEGQNVKSLRLSAGFSF